MYYLLQILLDNIFRLCGFPPFFSEIEFQDPSMLMNSPFWYLFNTETDVLRQYIVTGKFEFPSPFWDEVSQDGLL